MVDRLMNDFLGNIDPTVLYICIAILVICLIISLIKKAVTFVITVVVIILGLVFLVPQVTSYQENFNIGINEDNQLEIMVDGNEIVFGNSDDATISEIEIERETNGWYTVTSNYTDGSVGTFSVPGFMRDPVVNFIDSLGIEYTMLE